MVEVAGIASRPPPAEVLSGLVGRACLRAGLQSLLRQLLHVAG